MKWLREPLFRELLLNSFDVSDYAPPLSVRNQKDRSSEKIEKDWQTVM